MTARLALAFSLVVCAYAALRGQESAFESTNFARAIIDFVPKGPGRPPVINSLGTVPIQPTDPAPTSSAAPVASVPEPTPTAPETQPPGGEKAPFPDEVGEEQAVSDDSNTNDEEDALSPTETNDGGVVLEAPVEEEEEEDHIEPQDTDLVDVPVGSNDAPGPGEGYYPCHPLKGITDTSVTCTRVEIPALLCKRCPLHPTTSEGQFSKCDNIFNVETDDCKEVMQEYVDANAHCDPVRANSVPKWLLGDSSARKEVDYFLYSVCELCCYCVPMGVEKSDYRSLKDGHSRDSATLWDAKRGNCPAHAHYDLCKVLPQVEYLTEIDGPEEDLPPACPRLNDWLNSGRSTDWQTDPKTSIDKESAQFLDGALSALMCHRSAIWRKCFDI